MRNGWGTAVVLLLAVSAGGLQAQENPFGQLKPGQTVRVKTAGGSSVVTRWAAPTDLPFELARVDSLWVRGHAAGTGALIGAGAAGLASFGFYAWVCTAVGEGQGCDAWGTVTALALATSGVGALIGAGLGALVPTWRLRYARDRDLSIGPLLAPGRVGVALRF